MESLLLGFLRDYPFWSAMIILLLILVGIPLFIYSIIKLIKAARNNKKIDIRSISLDNKHLVAALERNAVEIKSNEFLTLGKEIRTKRGDYRADFSKASKKVYNQLLCECCENNGLSEEVCAYAENHFSSIRVKDLYNIINQYHTMRVTVATANQERFLSELSSITPEEFFEIKRLQKGDSVGVYIIHNESKDMYYVGQAKRMFFRINQHFTGHGNGDLYADYKYGDSFSIKIINLTDSGYSDLDLLEKDLIACYHAEEFGYNKTKGNR